MHQILKYSYKMKDKCSSTWCASLSAPLVPRVPEAEPVASPPRRNRTTHAGNSKPTQYARCAFSGKLLLFYVKVNLILNFSVDQTQAPVRCWAARKERTSVSFPKTTESNLPR